MREEEEMLYGWRLGGCDWNSREEQLNKCLVGKWEKGEEFLFNTTSLRRWGKHQWNLQGELSIKKLLARSFLLEFESPRLREFWREVSDVLKIRCCC